MAWNLLLSDNIGVDSQQWPLLVNGKFTESKFPHATLAEVVNLKCRRNSVQLTPDLTQLHGMVAEEELRKLLITTLRTRFPA